MMYSLTARYAIRTLAHLAQHRDQWVQAREIAAGTGIPANYLSKILSQLRKKRMVASQRGWGGGFKLEAAAMTIPIREVLEVFDGQRSSDACIFELKDCSVSNPCSLHEHWERVMTEYDHMLSTVTVGGLQAGPRP